MAYAGCALFISLCFFYAYKTWKLMCAARGRTLTDRTRSLQRQFTRCLIITTLNSALFAMFPTTLTSNGEKRGVERHSSESHFSGYAQTRHTKHRPRNHGCKSWRPFCASHRRSLQPLSWLPAANALTTLLCLKPYRKYVCSLLSCRKKAVGNGSVPPTNSANAQTQPTFAPNSEMDLE